MACLGMYNQSNERKPPQPPTISPRISFSNDFVIESASATSHSHHPQMVRSYRDAPVSSDFEFSVTNYSMMIADELFSQGRLLPLKESCGVASHHFPRATTTLRDELLVEEDDEEEEEFSLRPPKSSAKYWKGFLGLKKSHIGRKMERGEGSAADHMRSSFVLHDEPKTSQEMLNDGGQVLPR